MPNVRVIKPISPIMSAQEKGSGVKRRVAGYARVSTDSDEQMTSYEAQVGYYTDLINSRADWEFAGMYTDEGITALNTRRREGFKQMVSDALDGKIDLIVTKSVSRFARNTVDSLTTVRQLKEKGVEVFFEKENIYTMDGKGELLITIMSSLAQEESRSISENVTWGQRKRFADGKVSLPYKHFLGYEKGEDGLPKVVESEADVVRLIYRLFVDGMTFSAIAKHLGDNGVPSPAGRPKWQSAVVQSILTNEKYKGHALLQKTYCVDFLTKKIVKNNGEVQQYYVEDSHPAIIEPDEFDLVQAEIARRKATGKPTGCTSIFASKIACADCGGWYGKKVWGSYKGDKTRRREVWRCNDKYKRQDKPGKGCETPHISEEDIKTGFLTAFNNLIGSRDGLLEDCRLALSVLCDCSVVDAEIAEQQRELEVVEELFRKSIYKNARVAQDQSANTEREDGYRKRYEKAAKRIEKLEAGRQERLAKGTILKSFIKTIQSSPVVISEFDEKLWLTVIDKVTVGKDGVMTFEFRNGSVIII